MNNILVNNISNNQLIENIKEDKKITKNNNMN